MTVEQYFIAIKRNARGSAPKNWLEILEAVNGVEVMGAGPKRAQIRASADAIENVRDLLGGFCHIEKKVIHKPVSK